MTIGTFQPRPCALCNQLITVADTKPPKWVQVMDFGIESHGRCWEQRYGRSPFQVVQPTEVQAALPLLDGVEAGQEERAS